MPKWIKGIGSATFGNMRLRPDELEKVPFILVAGLTTVNPGESCLDRISKIISFGWEGQDKLRRSVISEASDSAIIQGSNDAYFDEVDQTKAVDPQNLVSFVTTVPSKDMLVESIQDSLELAA